MMLNKGRYDGERILSRLSVELMTIDQLTGQQKAENAIFFGGRSGRSGWGLAVQVITRRTTLGSVPGRFGWTGGRAPLSTPTRPRS
jgi:CubicO group peptidase (beta-lactamase class C family)